MASTTGEERVLLGKVLALERRLGFTDGAVLGGLERFVARHVPEAAPLVRGYARRDPAARKDAVDALERWLAGPFPPPWEVPVAGLPGVGKRRAELLAKLGIRTVEDLLTYVPRRLEDRSGLRRIRDLRDGEVALVEGVVRAKSKVKVRRGLELVKVALDDGTGFLFGIWFNQPWVWDGIAEGERYALWGKVQARFGELQIENPVWERAGANEQTGRLVPVYPATEGLSQPVLQGFIRRSLDRYRAALLDVVPEAVRERYGLLPRREALERIHAPRSEEEFELARRSLAFEELFLLQVGVLTRRRPEGGGRALKVDRGLLNRFLGRLPFELTPSQRRAMEAIERDLRSGRPMLRLLQGDVGSGKTVVAAAACVMAASAGAQGAIMAPTEILAEQHFLVLGELLEGLPIRIAHLGGGLGRRERRSLLQAIAAGEVDLVVGTHALIQDDVLFRNLALAVVDEQHRFGVVQRAILEAKGEGTNILVMSATPIPRTVVLTLYGEFSVSVLSETPRSRGRVQTVWLSASRREGVYREVGERLGRGERGYVVFPVIEGSEELDLRAATAGYEELRRRFPGVGVALLHGRMAPEEKRGAMGAFRRGEVQLLVATTVVEVGIDVPDASFLVIEHADRFGLAQLHQLRGRIGRAGQEAVCYALGDPTTDEGRARLAAFRDLGDGFKIAEADLRIRGPGDVLGTEQSGFVSRLKAADLTRDLGLLERAREEALRIVEEGVPEPLLQEAGRRFGAALALLGV